jgi:voltage-gated potassium channel
MEMAERPAAFKREHGTIFSPQVRKSNYAYLFAGLSLLLLVGPALDELLPHAAPAIATFCLLGALLLGVWSLADSVVVFRLGITLAALAIIFSCLDWFIGGRLFNFITLLIIMVFLVLSVYHAGRDVVFADVVDFNRLVGAMCIYEMLGLIWAVLYASIVYLSPGAFADDALNASSSFYEFVYYSFVTLTTLGYGDIAPAGGITKALAYMEAMVGQLYIAILIAGLVGSHLASRKQN